MPPMEIIDDTHRKFNSVIYRKSKRNNRYITNLNLNRAVWSFFNGEIPDGCEIHHIDENKQNDDISNLQCLTKSEHGKIHAKKYGSVKSTKMTKFICANCGKEFENVNTGNNKFCSEKCKNVYQHNVMYQQILKCMNCGKEFTCLKHDANIRKFCSRECAIKCRIANR